MTNYRLPLFRLLVALIAMLIVALGVPALAQDTAEEEPDTLVLSDTLNYDDIKRESIFTGNVIMTRGLMTLHSDKLVMREDDEGFQHGTATVNEGNLVYIRQENPEKFEVVEARGLRGEYDGKTEEVGATGRPTWNGSACGRPSTTTKAHGADRN